MTNLLEDLEVRLAVLHPPSLVHPLVGRAELESPSPEPFRGPADHEHPDLDTRDPLYVPRYLVRVWGWAVFSESNYRLIWETEAKGLHPRDLKPSERKGKR